MIFFMYHWYDCHMTFIAMTHGDILRHYIQEQGLKFQWVNERLGHKSRNTIHDWMGQDRLRPEQFAKLVDLFPEIMDYFPDVNVPVMQNMAREPQVAYGSSSRQEECEKHLKHFRDAYYSLLERHNNLLERMIEKGGLASA